MSTGSPRIGTLLPYVFLGVPTLVSVIVWLLIPDVLDLRGADSWLVLPIWVAVYFIDRTVLRWLFARRGLDWHGPRPHRSCR